MKKIISTLITVSILVGSPVALFAAGTTTDTTTIPTATKSVSPQEQALIKKLKQTKQKSKVTKQKIKKNISQNKKVVSKVKKERASVKKIKKAKMKRQGTASTTTSVAR